MEKKEKDEMVDAQKSTGKHMKLYMVCSFVAGLVLAIVIANLIVGCDNRSEVNNTVRYTNVGRAINDAMQEKEVVAGMKVDRVVKQGLDSIGIFEKDEKRGYYNQNTDKVLVDAVYTHVWFFSEGLAAVEKDGKIGFVNMKGKLVIPHKFMLRTNDHPDIAFDNGMCVIANGNGQLGVIDRKGEWIVKPVYEEVKLTDSGIIASTSDSKLLLSNKGDVIQKDLIVKVEPLSCNVQLKEKGADGNWKVQDVEVKMDYYVYYTNAQGDRCGLMDKDGNRLTEPIYSKIEALNDHLFSFCLLDGETQIVKSL